MAKLIILNGPKRSGKDTAAQAIQDYFGGPDQIEHVKLSQPLKDIVSQVTGTDFSDDYKDSPDHGFRSKSYRKLQIEVYNRLSEVFGPDWLGLCLLNHLEDTDAQCVVCSDGGRDDDIKALEHLGPSDLLIIQIIRPEHDFTNDIRHYISTKGATVRTIVNNDRDEYINNVIDLAGQFFAGELT